MPLLGLFKKESNLRVVLIVPEGKKDFFEKEFGGKNVIVYGLKGCLRRIDDFFKDFAHAAVNTKSHRIMRSMNFGFEYPITQKLFIWAPLFRKLVPLLYSWLMPQNMFREVLDEYKPALVFSTDIFSTTDCRLVHEAKKRGISTIGMVRSWDNLTTKGGFRVIPDILVVNNEIIKEEATKIHGIDEKIIKIVGIPHYDRYGKEPCHSRQQFFAKIGADLQKRLILFSPLGDRFFSGNNYFDKEMIEILQEIIPPTHQLLVRCPPADSVNLEGFKPSPSVIFDYPGTRFGSMKKTEMSPGDDDHLIDTLFYSDLVICGFTTLCIDAAVCDKPIISIAFDGKSTLPYFKSVKRHSEFDHIQPILKSGGVRLAENIDELRSFINLYLNNSSIDKEGRAKIYQEQAWKTDGMSSQRLFEILYDRH